MPPSVVPSESIIRKALSDFHIEVNATQVGQIQEYIKLLLAWNEKVNLTAIREPLIFCIGISARACFRQNSWTWKAGESPISGLAEASPVCR